MRPTVLATTLTALLLTVMAAGQEAQSLGAYRNLSLGTTVAGVAATTGVSMSAFRTLHERPALLQEFEWRPSHYAQTSTRPDAVDQITFSFYNDQLSRMVVAYDSRQTEGMTRADLVSALEAVYGVPAPSRRAADSLDFGSLAATWQTEGASIELFRGSDAWRLVLTSRALHASALRAAAEAVRREEQEAPARELAQRKQDEAAERARQEQTRRTNKATFQP